VLQGPTLIKFVESFIENNCIYIVMEYADGGSLDQKIRLYQNRGQKFETEEILRYMAQITLGVMAMHSKNILHRDIKTQNIFITQNDILKMGDFGISR
jgi:NIMA (never in mitosis gene a)-related kinase